MKFIIKPIKLDQQGGDVYLLHQVLSALGLAVSNNEVSIGKAGRDTQRKVRELQKQLGIRALRNASFLDEKTIIAIEKEMLSKGFLSSRASFTASGNVKLANGKIKKQQQLIAYDIDLKGVGLYRDLKTLAELLKLNAKGGFEYLGKAVTDSKGHYSFTFFEFQYGRAEGGKGEKADIVVFAIDDKENIVGRSQLVNLESYDQKGFVRGVDIVLDSKKEEGSEYQVLTDTLSPFLKQNNIGSFADIANSAEQLAFTASELGLNLSHLTILADVYLLFAQEGEFAKTLDLLYGLGRQDITLSWEVLFKKQRDELQTAIGHSVDNNIVAKPADRTLAIFLSALQKHTIQHVLNDKSGNDNNQLNLLLTTALPEEPQRLAFLKAVNEFEGSDFPKFWKKLSTKPEFRDKPELVSGIQLTQQLHTITNFQPLVDELHKNRGIKSVEALIDLDKAKWQEIIAVSGIPDFIESEDDNAKTDRYADVLENQLNAAFPTQRIIKMIRNNELVFENTEVQTNLNKFLNSHKDFDFRSTQIHKYVEENKASLEPSTLDALAKELMELQRLFQVSSSPAVLKVLRENKLTSAYAIAHIPRKNFINTYGVALGGADIAAGVHNRGQFLAKRAEMNAMVINDASWNTATPETVFSAAKSGEIEKVLEEKISNYKNLFGSPDLCECQHCRSVFSPAAYFVELLRFLEKSTYDVETEGHNPYEYLAGNPEANITGRRPDLAKLELSCDNTNTETPYIDLSNEVMEAYVIAGSLESYDENTIDVTKDELRANPQHTQKDAYLILSNNHPSKPTNYPFNLPFHQPLSAIKTYSDFLNVSRYEVLQAVNPAPSNTGKRAISAEALGFSEEEYRLLVKKDFAGADDNTELHQLYGYDDSIGLDDLTKIGLIQKFMNKTQISYLELIELVNTQFINPHQSSVAYFDFISSALSLKTNTMYLWLEKMAASDISELEPPVIAALQEYETNRQEGQPEITRALLVQWAGDNFDGFKQVITLFEHYSACKLETTRLRSILGLQDFPDTFNDEEELIFGESKIESETWLKFHDFIRLWKKLAWSIHDVDLMLAALNQQEITADTITKLEFVCALQKTSKLPLNKLAVLWGHIDTYGDKSLYKKLFLNKAVQDIDSVFIADEQSQYLKKTTVKLGDHQLSIQAAYRITAEELSSILDVESMDISDDLKLNLENLSRIYRYVVLADTLKLDIKDLCKLIDLFDTESSLFNSPKETYEFYQLAVSTKEARFKPALLDYIFTGNSLVDANITLEKDKISQAANAIVDGLAATENKQDQDTQLLSNEIVSTLFSVQFEENIIHQLIAIVDGTAKFEVITNTDLTQEILGELASKYTYTKESGQLTCLGIMTTEEQEALKLLFNSTIDADIEQLFQAPEVFLSDHFTDIFKEPDSTPLLLNRPTQDPEITLNQKLEYIYSNLEVHLKHDAVGRILADLVELGEITTSQLIENNIDEIIGEVLNQDLNSFSERINRLHRAALFISGFELTEKEVRHFTQFSSDFDNINFADLSPDNWKRIHAYVGLRNTIPQGRAQLTDIFAFANNPDSVLTIEEQKKTLLALISQATAWDKNNMKHLVILDDFNNFKNEIALRQTLSVMNIIAKTGLSAETVVSWGSVNTGFEALHSTAQTLKNAVKSKYSNTQWLEVAGGLSDKIREQQKQALMSYLLVQDSIKDAGVKDADGLYEHLLIDVQMGACMNTSRIVQANAAIQLFVNRILLNLEDDIPPNAIDTEQWEWMKNYRVWEANRKVFLYPENWLEPEWRNDRSEFFKDLESHLLQNDITERSVEQGLRNYLMSMSEVANLDVCGMHQENYDDGKLKFLHVFGRTHNLPYKYFYRRWNEYEKWSAWEKVPVDIRAVEDGENSGVHLIPVVWKGRLFLFWPEFMEKAIEDGNKADDMHDRAEIPIGQQEPNKYWEIRLAWSEYVDDTWGSKQVSKEYIDTKYYYVGKNKLGSGNNDFRSQVTLFTRHKNENFNNLRLFRFTPKIYNTSKVLSIKINCQDIIFPWFEISDIQSRITIHYPTIAPNIAKTMMLALSGSAFYSTSYDNFYMSCIKSSELKLLNQSYLLAAKKHRLITDNRYGSEELSLDSPFVFIDGERSYFVKNRKVTIFNGIKKPEYTPPIGNKLFVLKTPFSNDLNLQSNKQDVFITENTTTTSVSFFSSTGQIRANFHQSKELTFHVFYHPFSSQFVTSLNTAGISGVMSSDTNIHSDEESTFTTYNPNFKYGFVHKMLSTDDCPGYKENICFDPKDANSQYNWELFFHAPLYIATRLSKNGKYKEAMQWFHYIFDPTTNEKATSEEDTARYWKVKPLKAESANIETLEQWFKNLEPNPANLEEIGNIDIDEWRNNPFDPHLVASNRPVAYMKHVVIKYIENLMAWGDSLFRQFTRESVYEAIQIYVIASHVLGKRPEEVPKRGKIKTETYANLRNKLDDFGNAIVELENLFPYSGGVSNLDLSTPTNILGIGEALYFCIPANDKLLAYWDTVTDRLFKIRHCQDIDGVERSLALFSPAIDPTMLIQARSQGLSLGSVLADLSSPPPLYRFNYLLQKANEFCGDVKTLGSAVLSALEKKDGEELSRLRATQETNMLERVTGIRERQVLSAKVGIENLLKVRETAKFRLQYYKDLLGDDSDEPLDAPSLGATLTANGPLPGDTSISPIDTKIDMSLVDSDESGVKLIGREKEELDKSADASFWQKSANLTETIGSSLYFIPEVTIASQPMGWGVTVTTGGQSFGLAASATAKAFSALSYYRSNDAQRSAKFATYLRRTNDWALQANLVIRDIIQLDKQITSADIQLQVAQKELKNHKQQIENSQQTEEFLRTKFSNQELYQWMKEQISSVYQQSYNLAYEMAKKAEKSYQRELGIESSSFIQYGYWDNAKQGLVSGEKLQLALRQLENSFLNNNRREYELSKHISLLQLDPLALLLLKTTGKCTISIPESLFDMDAPGHYFRRIKTVAVSIPCVIGTYASVNCTLRLLKSSFRQSKALCNGQYSRNLTAEEDNCFVDQFSNRESIVTSSAQNDSGLFETNLRDERYLPFENSGVISEWELQLPANPANDELQQFDYSTISDVIMHMRYTARDGGQQIRDGAIEQTRLLASTVGGRLFSIRHEFPTEWMRFKEQASVEKQRFELIIQPREEHYPFWLQGQLSQVSEMNIVAQDNKGFIDIFKVPEISDSNEINNNNKISTLAANPVNEFKLYFSENELEDIWIVLSWGSE